MQKDNLLTLYGDLPLRAALPGKDELLLDSRFQLKDQPPETAAQDAPASVPQQPDRQAALAALGLEEKDLEILRFVAKRNEKEFKKHNRSLLRKFAGRAGGLAAGVIGGTAAFAIGITAKASYGFVRRYPRFSFLTIGVLTAGASTHVTKQGFVETVVGSYNGVRDMDEGTKKDIAQTAMATAISYIAQAKNVVTNTFEAIDEINARTGGQTDAKDIKRAMKPVRSSAIEAGKKELPQRPAPADEAAPAPLPLPPSQSQSTDTPNIRAETGKVFPVIGPVRERIILPDGSERDVPLRPAAPKQAAPQPSRPRIESQPPRAARPPGLHNPALPRPKEALRKAVSAPKPKLGTLSVWEKMGCSVYYFSPKEAAACTAEAMRD